MSAEDHIAKLMQAARESSRTFSLEEEDFEIEEQSIQLDPVAGFDVLGTLTDDENKLYRIMIGVEIAIDEVNDSLGRAINLNMAQRAIDNNGVLDPSVARRIIDTNSAARVEELLRFDALYNKLHSEFWYMVRCRLQTFATILEIRAGFTVCRVGYKYNVNG